LSFPKAPHSVVAWVYISANPVVWMSWGNPRCRKYLGAKAIQISRPNKCIYW